MKISWTDHHFLESLTKIGKHRIAETGITVVISGVNSPRCELILIKFKVAEYCPVHNTICEFEGLDIILEPNGKAHLNLAILSILNSMNIFGLKSQL